MITQEENVYLDNGIEYLKSAQEVSNYIKTLPICDQQNNLLIAKLRLLLHEARTDAFLQGLSMGIELTNFHGKENTNE